MRLDRIDLNLFVVFDTIYREHSVTKAARQLHLTQPAISNSLARLREIFDDQLFVRTPEGMMPTPLADNILGDVRKALALLDKSVGTSAQFDAMSSEKVFKLAMNDLAEALVLPELRLRMAQLAPNAGITCYYYDRQTATAELKAGTLDILLDVPVINSREFESKRVAEFPYTIMMNPNHTLARQELSLEAYLLAEHLHVSSRRKGRGQVDIALHGLGKNRKIAMRLQNHQVATSVTTKTDLLLTIPKATPPLTGLIEKTPPFKIEPLTWNLFWHRSAHEDPANRWIRSVITDIAQSLDLPID